MTPESLAAALDTMPEQRQAIADGVATTDTYEAVTARVAVFEARAKGCAELAAISTEDWSAQQDHVLACALCKPPDPKRLRERVEYLAPGLVAVPDDEERKWLAFLSSPVRTVSDVVTRPIRALTDLMTKSGPVVADPQVWKAAAAVVGLVVFLLANPSSERVERRDQVTAEPLLPGPSDNPPTSTPPGAGPSAPPPTAGPTASAGQTITVVSDGPAVHHRGGASGVTKTGPGQYDVTTLGGNGFAMVSPVGQNQARCRTTVEPARTRVTCDTDTDWNLTYTDNAVHHDPSASAAYLTTGSNRSWSSNGEVPAVTRSAVGFYEVQYQGIGNPKIYPADAVLVSASGPEPRYCRVWAWNGYSHPPGVLVQIRCHDQAGAAADSAFALAYLRSP